MPDPVTDDGLDHGLRLDTIAGGMARRVQQARRAADLSQLEVAQALGIPRSAVSLIESGQRAVSGVDLAKLSRLFGVSPSALLFDPDADRILRFFRTDAVIDKQDQQIVEAAIEHLRDYADIEQLAYGTQRYSLPSYPVQPGRAVAQGEYLAAQERRRLGLDVAPAPSIIEILEHEGVKIMLCTFPPSSHVSGCYLFSHELGPCVVINGREIATRQRFTAAHEYGHFLMNRTGTGGAVCDTRHRSEHSEIRANSFAAAFLLPSDGVEAILREHGAIQGGVHAEHVIHITHHFGVSYAAALWRLLNLRWITVEDRERLAEVSPIAFAEMLGFPPAPTLSEPQPHRLRIVAIDAWRSGSLPLQQVATILGVGANDLARVLSRAEPDALTINAEDDVSPDWF